ncbi:MAG TPA: hypothetical protein VL651_03295 [Bacteroidia bacterium]|jgi:hypothetical protein|nr:hypothetical protein [Bacteroidia bacterium]
MKKTALIFCLLFASALLRAQTSQPLDTVYLMSGKIMTGVVKDSTDEQLKVLVPAKNGSFKADFVDLDLVFSIKYGNGTENVLYKQDTLFGNYFTPQEVRYFMVGERDARSYYRCRGWCAGAFLFGAAGGYFRSLLSFLPPFAFAGASTGFRVQVKPNSVSDPQNIRYDTYVLGYEKDARQRRFFRTLLWGGIGMAAGIATATVIYNGQTTPFTH